jgi:hypothetical protein
MQTYSHFLMTAALTKLDQKVTWVPPMQSAFFLFGSVLPDIPLVLLTIGYGLYRLWFDPMGAGEFIFDNTYDTLYFTNPVWVTGHSLFHSPILIMLYLAVSYWGWRRGYGWGAALFWLALACGIHSFVDIITHVDDGPLLLFPFNSEIRFRAPISYWDDRYGGREVAQVEHLMDLGLLAWLVVPWLVRKLRPKQLG